MIDRVMDFLSMGGYALYVWPSYGLALIVLMGILVSSIRQQKTTRLEVQRWLETHPGRGERS